MFKKTVISICLMMVLCTSVYAEQEEICGVQEVIQPEVMESAESIDTKEEPVFDADKARLPSKEISMDMYFDEISERLSKKINLKKPEEFVSIMTCSPRAMYENVSDYTAFVCEYNLTDAQLEVINRILDKGTTIQSLIQVYKFWLTTDYDFSMVEEICALEDKYFSEYWYESAFNDITEDTHGVLTIEDINNYRDMGISTDEILAANVLCRKEGQNIFNILDGVCNGVSIEQQVIEIYGIDSLPEGDSLYQRVMEAATCPDTSAIQTMLPLKNVQQLDSGKITNISRDVIEQKIESELSRLRISKPDISRESDYNLLVRSHLPLSVQRTLLNKGYTPEEIELASRGNGLDLLQQTKRAREALNK